MAKNRIGMTRSASKSSAMRRFGKGFTKIWVKAHGVAQKQEKTHEKAMLKLSFLELDMEGEQ